MAKGLEPNTRRMIVIVLGVIAITSIVAEVILKLNGSESSEALITLAATSIGGIAGMAVPHQAPESEKIVLAPDAPETFTGYGPTAPQQEVFYGGGAADDADSDSEGKTGG
jgi:glucose dehydrogenase